MAIAYALVGLLALGVWLDVGLLLSGMYLFVHAARISSSPDQAERERIDAFLANKRIALVGASADPQHFSRIVMAEFIKHGVEVVPIHPLAAEIAGCTAFSRARGCRPAGAMRAGDDPRGAVCSDREGLRCSFRPPGVATSWRGAGAVSEQAVELAARHGLQLVAGRCPLMFLGHPPAAIHRLHASLLRATGRYPEQRRSAETMD